MSTCAFVTFYLGVFCQTSLFMKKNTKRETGQLREIVRQRIRRLRIQRQLTQEGLCDRAGISVDAVSRIEGGSRIPSLETMEKISKALGIRVVDLVDTGEIPRTRYSGPIQRIINTLEKEPLSVQQTAEKVVKALIQSLSSPITDALKAAENHTEYTEK